MITLTIEELEGWYKKQLYEKSKDFIKKAERSYKVVDRTLKDIQGIANELREASKEDEDVESVGTATRFAMKINEVVEDFDLSKDITYESTEAMVEETQDFIKELWGAGARWIRRMDKKHKNTIKQLDGYMKDLGKEMKELAKLLYEYSWIEDLERIGSRIDTLKDLTHSSDVFEEEIRQIKLKLAQAKEEYAEAKKEVEEFKAVSNVSEVLNLDEEMNHISGLLRMKLNTLKKPVKKFLQANTSVRISPAGQKALNDYFEEPFQAIIDDADGVPNFVEGLTAMETAIERNEFKLKDRLARRAQEEIELIKKGELAEFQAKAKELEQKRSEYAGSEIYEKTESLEERVEEAEKNLEYHSNDLLRVRDDIKRQLEKVKDFRQRIETEIKKSFGESVRIELEVSLEPLLEKCVVDLPEGVSPESSSDF